MNIKRKTVTSLIVFILFFISSCLTTSMPTDVTYSIEDPVLFENEDVKIQLTPLPADILINLFGTKGNVFTNYPGLLMKKQAITYKIEINTKRDNIKFDLRKIILKIGEVSGQSQFQDQLLAEWKNYLRTSNERSTAKSLASEYMFSNNFTVTPEQPVSGLIVFLKKFPVEGSKKIYIGIQPETSDFQKLIITLPEEE